jgi:hypothetical protein
MTNPATPEDLLPLDSTTAQSYITVLQVITRMSTNSANCKTLCLTLIVAILAIITDKSKTSFTFVALIPIIVLGLLDAYYLGLEQGFRNQYDEFVEKFCQGTAQIKDLYVVKPIPKKPNPSPATPNPPTSEKFNPITGTAQGLSSFSVYPFYLTLGTVLLLGKFFVFNQK